MTTHTQTIASTTLTSASCLTVERNTRLSAKTQATPTSDGTTTTPTKKKQTTTIKASTTSRVQS